MKKNTKPYDAYQARIDHVKDLTLFCLKDFSAEFKRYNRPEVKALVKDVNKLIKRIKLTKF